jgi:hypothetical protein
VRVLFAFDRKRKAILLVGGDKSADWTGWYTRNTDRHDRFDEHQAVLANEETAPWRPLTALAGPALGSARDEISSGSGHDQAPGKWYLSGSGLPMPANGSRLTSSISLLNRASIFRSVLSQDV